MAGVPGAQPSSLLCAQSGEIHDGVEMRPEARRAADAASDDHRVRAVYLTEGDTLKSEHLFFDQMDFLGQLGLLPG